MHMERLLNKIFFQTFHHLLKFGFLFVSINIFLVKLLGFLCNFLLLILYNIRRIFMVCSIALTNTLGTVARMVHGNAFFFILIIRKSAPFVTSAIASKTKSGVYAWLQIDLISRMLKRFISKIFASIDFFLFGAKKVLMILDVVHQLKSTLERLL